MVVARSHSQARPAQPVRTPLSFPIPIESRKERHQQRKAENDAYGVAEERILMPFYQCDICSSCIGPDYHEQELYLYPVQKQIVYIEDKATYFESTWLHICGGCARDRKRNLSEHFCMIQPEYWITTILIDGDHDTLKGVDKNNEEELLAIRKALDEEVERMYAFHFFLLVMSYSISLRDLFACARLPKPTQRIPQKKARKHFTLL